MISAVTIANEELRQLADLVELAGSADGVLDAERHLSLLFGRRPSLRELVDELMERRRRESDVTLEPEQVVAHV